MGSRRKRRCSAEKAILKIGSKHDRFKSKLPIPCNHNWQPFGVPIDANGADLKTLRCNNCKLTKTIKTIKRSRGAA